MSWLSPILSIPDIKKPFIPDRSIPVVIHGKQYPSITAASQSLKCSWTKAWAMSKA